jgi:hypothetical protein
MNEQPGTDADHDAPPVPWETTAQPAVEPPVADAARSTASKLLEAAAWIAGVLGLLFFGRVFAVLNGSRSLSAQEGGELFGAILGAVLLGVFVRWVVVRIRHRGRLLSPWILVIAVLASATPDHISRISEAVSRANGGAFEIRSIVEGGEARGLLVVADLAADSSPEFRRGIETGWEENTGAEAHESTIGGQFVVVATAAGVGEVIWVEPPFALTVYAPDVATAEALAASVIAAYR